MSERFLFFGCWNSINCEKDDNYLPRDVILEYINKYEKDVKYIFIAGDNWYATTFLQYVTETNIKLYLKDILISGYYKLYELGKKIHIAVGNHDEDVGKKDKDDEKEELKKNCMINTQRHYIQKIIDHISKQSNGNLLRNRTYTNSLGELGHFRRDDKYPPTLESLKTSNDIVVANDKIIKLYVEEIGVTYNDKYIMIVINTNYFDLEIKVVNEYLEKIKLIIEKENNSPNRKHLFVMGHIPLFTHKIKKGKDPISITAIKSDSDIINKFYDILVANKCIYLCADTHNFSIMKITKKGNNLIQILIQITSGTGGAYPDVIYENYKQSEITKIENYEISHVSINSFGYSSVNIDETNNITISYNNVIKIDNTPGDIYTYDITDKLELLKYDTRQRSYDDIEKITIIINEVNSVGYKKSICKLIKSDDIEAINKMIVRDHKNEVSCYEKEKDKIKS